ncbi:kinesin-like protein KIF11-B isoform X2 [Cylas formicarius]|uniref:kinesin-like protein KIF11-B isoform X2 n=1 Tax=Cylas formicarius TaxID=197179 RepID=UPI0029585B54|nr:kinesin-like protein KIF11-B isoform X2 [Cylas formicarius]
MSSSSKKKPTVPIQNIKVVVRVRPITRDENGKKIKSVVYCASSKEIQVRERKYQFDKVFPPESSQMDIYLYAVSPMISDVIAGYNCTVFAYGPTGTGKTHTMIGGDPSSSVNWKDDELAGCIPRAAGNIFDTIASMDIANYSIHISFLELYNEEVRDLLNEDDQSPSLSIFNDNKGSVYIPGLKEVTVFNSNEIYSLIQQGTNKRRTACTLSNNHSSRSHTVFTITVHTRECGVDNEELLKTDSLGGHTKTCIIATVSPLATAYEETTSTLEYACRARDIKNTPLINAKVTKAELIEEMANEIDKLKRDLDAARSGEGFYVDKDNWEKMQLERQGVVDLISLKNNVIDDMKRKLSELKTLREMKLKEFDQITKECRKEEGIINKATRLLQEKTQTIKQEEYVSSYYESVASETTTNASKLLETTHNLSSSQAVLHRKLEMQYMNNHRNEQMVKEKTKHLISNLNAFKEAEELLGSLPGISVNVSKELQNLQETMENRKLQQDRIVSLQQYFDEQYGLAEKLVKESHAVVSTGENVIQRCLDCARTKRNKSSKIFQHLKEHEQESLKRSEGISDLLDSIKLFLMREKERFEILNGLKTSYGNIGLQSSERVISLDTYNLIAKQNSLANDISKRNTSEINTNLVELLKSATSLETDISKAKTVENLNASVTELEQKLLAMRGLGNQIVENTHDLQNHVKCYSNTVGSTIKSILESNETQAILQNHVEKVSNILNNCYLLVHTEILDNIIPTKRTGDTPKQCPLNFPKRISDGRPPKEALIKKFEEEELQEDIEKLMSSFDSPADCSGNLDMN